MLHRLGFSTAKLGIALGGGAVLGAAHIGVLKVLEKHSVPISYLCGTSVGSLIGAIYAGGARAAVLEECALEIDWRKLILIKPNLTGLIANRAIEFTMREKLLPADFSQLRIPFRAIATDIKYGRRVVFSEGSLPEAIKASTLFPGVFTRMNPPMDNLFDGGILENVPVSELHVMGATLTLAVDVIPPVSVIYEPRNIVEVITRSINMLLKKSSEEENKKADFLLEPVTEEVYYTEIQKIPRLIQLGEEAAERIIPQLQHYRL